MPETRDYTKWRTIVLEMAAEYEKTVNRMNMKMTRIGEKAMQFQVFENEGNSRYPYFVSPIDDNDMPGATLANFSSLGTAEAFVLMLQQEDQTPTITALLEALYSAKPKKSAWPTLRGGGDYLKALFVGDERKLASMGSVKTLGSQSGQEGGFTVPTDFKRGMVEIFNEAAIVRPRAFEVPVDGGEVEIPLLNTEGTAQGESNLLAGFLPQWVEAGEEKPELNPEFALASLVPHELSGAIIVKNATLRDSADTLAIVLQRFGALSLAIQEDQAYLTGNGVGMPIGVLNAPGTITVPRATAGAISAADLPNMLRRLLALSHERAVWVASVTGMDDIGAITGPNPETDGDGHIMLHGRPVYVTERVPAIGQTGDLMLCDFSLYYVSDVDFAVDMSIHPLFASNRTIVRLCAYSDGQPALARPVLPKHSDQGLTVSPFVILGEGQVTT